MSKDCEDGICITGVELAWIFLIASLLSIAAAIWHGDYGGLLFPAFIGPLSIVRLLLAWREGRKP